MTASMNRFLSSVPWISELLSNLYGETLNLSLLIGEFCTRKVSFSMAKLWKIVKITDFGTTFGKTSWSLANSINYS